MLRKYLQDFFSYQLSHILGGRKYSEWAQNTLTLQKNIPIKNKKLAEELEKACQKKGFLTYAEFLTIDQFGENGYHATHKEHGMTDTKFRWPEALAALCQKKGFRHIVEFGLGDGNVGARTLLEAKNLHHKLLWSGIEINKNLREEAKKIFRKKGVTNQIFQLVEKIEGLDIPEKCLFVFSYSIDNLIPDVFINTTQEKQYPNSLLGISVKNSLLSETFIHSSLKKGMYKDSFGYSWDIRGWQLNNMQRVYLPLATCRTLIEATKAMPIGSQILIIDEFQTPSHDKTYHFGIPRDLETYSRDFTDFEKFYKTAGSNLLYFPTSITLLISFLMQLGFSLEENTSEHALAYSLSGRNAPHPKHPRTLALLTSPKKINVKKTIFTV